MAPRKPTYITPDRPQIAPISTSVCSRTRAVGDAGERGRFRVAADRLHAIAEAGAVQHECITTASTTNTSAATGSDAEQLGRR